MSLRRRSASVVALLVLALSACTTASNSTPPPSRPAGSTAETAAEIESYIEANTGRYDQIRSIRAQVAGQSRLEHYRHGADAATHLHMWFVTPSVVSMLIGIAIADGKISGVDATLAELLPNHVRDMSAAQRAITLEQLLTMTGGLPDQEYLDKAVAARPDRRGVTASGLLEVGLQAPPGDRFLYSDTSAHLVSVVLAEATGMSPLDYGRRMLFEPVGIRTEPANTDPLTEDGPPAAFEQAAFAWTTDADGVNFGCCFLKLTANDMVTLGQLYLDGGRANGRQILARDWIAQSTRPTELNSSYGYLWWLGELNGHAYYAAAGGGQTIIILPAIQAVITIASTAPPDTPPQDVVNQTDLLQLTKYVILPSID